MKKITFISVFCLLSVIFIISSCKKDNEEFQDNGKYEQVTNGDDEFKAYLLEIKK